LGGTGAGAQKPTVYTTLFHHKYGMVVEKKTF